MATMEKLAAEQEVTAQKLVKKLELIGKEPIARRTQSYILQAEKEIIELWTIFSTKHEEIVNIGKLDHDYFNKKFYQQTEQVKQKALAKLSAYRADLDKAAASDRVYQKIENADVAENVNTAQINESNVRIKREKIRMEALRKQLQQVNMNVGMNNAVIELQSKNLTEYWRQLESLHEEVLIFTVNENELTDLGNEFEHLRKEYVTCITAMQERLTTSSMRPTESDVRLPRLNIPIFEGKYENWTAFHDIFIRLIHENKKLANVERMQYLKTNLKGEPARLLNHLEISDGNYELAWEIIKDRYQNKRKLLSVHLQALIALPKLEVESIKGLKKIHDTMKECLHGIKNLGVDTLSWAPIVIHLTIQKFDHDTLKLYEQSHTNARDIPTFDHFYKFLVNRFQSLEAVGETTNRSTSHTQNKMNNRFKLTNIKNYHATAQLICRYCQQPHTIYNCPEFLSLETSQRNEAIKRKNLCRNCMNHTAKEKCRSRKTCTICKKQHHTLLHQPNHQYQNYSQIQRTIDNKENDVLLATAMVKVTNQQGKQELLRVLIDTGAQISCITEHAAQILSLPRMNTCIKLSGLGATEDKIATGKINVQIQPRFPSQFRINIEALILPKLTKNLPNAKTAISLPWQNCILADPTFNQPGPIDMIIGADTYPTIILNGIRKSKNGVLAQNTEFGWIISGKIPYTANRVKVVAMLSLDDQIRRFWEIEEVPDEGYTNTMDDICEKHYKKTHHRNKDGTYTVQIPFKESKPVIGDSRRQALARLLQNEKKFQTNRELEQEYKKFIAEYIQLGHMEKIKEPRNTTENVCYLPHQAVIKKDSTTTKLRVVFDASAKTSTGISLNDNMLAGPRLQPDLAQILLRWRKYRFVFTADIEKMYRQIKLAEKDQHYHRILWRFNQNEPIEEYKLTTVTYGTTSAPFLAIKTIQQLAKDEQRRYPQASKVVLEDFYVDDVMSGGNTLDEVLHLQDQLIKLLEAGGFKLRKWTSNNIQIIRNVPENKRERGILNIGKDETIKTLGIHWNPTLDMFQFKIHLESSEEITKRAMLSKIARIFDPLGWITPVTLRAKIMLQELWKTGISWDEKPPSKLYSEWTKYQKKLSDLEKLRIQRWINYGMNEEEIEIHGFSDASERAYAAVIYSKKTMRTGDTLVSLITAKSKVAPVKSKLTVPRLELCGAELLSKLMSHTLKTLGLKKLTIHLWSDSMITIARIKGNPSKLPNFEANRIRTILSLTNPEQWRYVKTEENPADCASRGLDPDQIKDNKLWWNGPTWLKLDKKFWPSEILPIMDSVIAPEKLIMLATKEEIGLTSILERFSTLNRCIRVVAYCKRFSNNCKRNKATRYGNLLAEEIEEARKAIIQSVQTSEFKEETQMLKKNRPLPTKSKLLPLSPFIDKDGIIRIGGRLQLSNLTYEEQHPILLPQKTHLTELVIQEAHRRTLHGGNQQTLAYLRREYWIINARSNVKKHIHNCNVCFRNKPKTCQQIMGYLPSPRVTPSPPFTHAGIDYAGPIQLKASTVARTKVYKGYIAIFICLATKAVHLEAVGDLTSEACLAAFKRFTARRGHCKHIYSDCGTNFIGAHKILDKELQVAIQSSKQEVANMIANDGTHWHFNPPAAPHMGGIWEAGVKSIKHHLRRIVGSTLLTYEELTTVLSQIEACLNSRPLCPLNDDPTDCNILTPGHFLIGRALINPPILEGNDCSLRTRWKLVNKLSDDFWKIWSNEYLSRLQQKPKWWKEEENLKLNELVLIKEDNMPSAKWKLGRIIEVHPGQDGKTRVVTLRCGNNIILKRPVTKLCRLPVQESSHTVGNTKDQTILASINNHEERPSLSPTVKETKKRKAYDTPQGPETGKRRYLHEIEKAAQRSKVRKGIKIRPVFGYSNLVSIEDQKIAKRKYEAMKEGIRDRLTPKSKGKILSTVGTAAVIYLSLLSTITMSKAAYTITNLQPGMYIEHIGEANLRRGTLRVEVTLPLNTTSDTIRINGIIEHMHNVCMISKEKVTAEDIHCASLVQHLKIQSDYLLNEINMLKEQDHSRSKRGLLGKALQYVFGVNDEVYSDISKIQENQHILQQASLHQSTVMLTTISHMNETEYRITNKINALTTKLNDVMKEVNIIEGWFTTINKNMVNLHILTAYQIATNILDEIERQYTKIISALKGQGSILEFISSSRLNNITDDVAKKLPNTLYISNNPEEKIHVQTNKTSLLVQGYFSIAERDTYTIMKVTPIPQRLENGTYIVADIKNVILCVNYNKQTFFELAEDNVQKCINKNKHQLNCMPTAISHIESNSNCVVDEIYDRPQKRRCSVKTFSVPNILWKHLYMANTWMFITTIPTPAGIKCNGIREDLELNGTGIIQISKECIITTKENTLISEIFDKTIVEASFIKPIDLKINENISFKLQRPDQIQSEQILKSSDQLLGIITEQQLLHKDLASTTLNTIGHHVISSTVAVFVSIIIIITITTIKRKYQIVTPTTPKTTRFELTIPATTDQPFKRTDATGEAENV